MEDNWEELNALKRRGEEERKARRMKASKDRLIETGSKRIKTSFVGAVAAIEKHMPFLFETEEGKEIFASVKKEIFDNGNDQIRDFEKDLDVYEINFKQYRLELKIGEDK